MPRAIASMFRSRPVIYTHKSARTKPYQLINESSKIIDKVSKKLGQHKKKVSNQLATCIRILLALFSLIASKQRVLL